MKPDEFIKSKHRQMLSDFLATETGINFLFALSHLCPQRKVTLPTGMTFQTGVTTELMALKLSEVVGYEICQKAIIMLSTIPEDRKVPRQEPTYQESQRKQPGVK